MKFVCRQLFHVLIVVFLITYTSTALYSLPSEQKDLRLISVRKKIDATKAKVSLDETTKHKLLKIYYETENHLEELLNLQRKAQIAQNQLKSLPDDIKRLENKIKEIEVQSETVKDQKFSQYSSEELAQRLAEEKNLQSQLNVSLSQLETQLAEQRKRPKRIREQLAEIKTLLANIGQDQAKLIAREKHKQVLDAYKNLIDSHSSKLNMNMNWLDLEKKVNPLTIRAHKLELNLLNLQGEQLVNRIKEIEDFQILQREQEIETAQAELIEAQQQAAGKPPVIQKIIMENFEYTQLLQEVGKKQEQYNQQNREIESRYDELQKDFKSAEKKINLAGLSPALGNLLRDQRRKLPLRKANQDRFDNLQSEIANASLKLFQLEEVQKGLVDMNKTLSSRMTKFIATENEEAEISKTRSELRLLLNEQKTLVSELSSQYSDYSRSLADVDFSLQQLVTLGEKYKLYLDQRLLWVPSAPVINKHYVQDIFSSVKWIAKTSHWQRLAQDISTSLQASPFLALVGIVVLALQLWFRRMIKSELRDLLKKSSKIYSDRFVFTFYGLGYVVLLVLPWALLTAWLGWLILINHQATLFSLAVAHGLLIAAVPLLIISFFYQLFKPNGFMQAMFQWKEHNVHLLFKLIRFMRRVIVPVAFISGMFANDAYAQHSHTLGRMALIVGMLAIAYFFHRLGHPTKGLAKDFYQANPGSWKSRMRYFWYGLLIIMPLDIIGFAVTGYYQSALELQNKFIIVLRLIFFTVLGYEVVIRWLVLANRQLALQNARQKRKLLEQTQDKDKEREEPVISLEEEALLDIPKINEQSRKILRVLVITTLLVGVWLTLRDILPALAVFDRVVFWQHTTLIDGKEVPQAITLVNIFVGVLYFILMLVFVKNFPGLLDLLIAGRYSLTAGGRYAFIQLVRYGVITATIIVIANQLGGSWSQVQWLVAALGVGLGFGLQEIFANLVSGIILLFERPIRVGDTVTIGDIDGRVSRIHMRATTIVNWDQKELVVPNKTFITEKLVNWTLSDTITRVVIPVGVAYGSDADQVKSLLEQVVSETPLVLKEPAPVVFFLEFGDSALNFSVRVFVRELGDRLPVMDDLHRRIKRAFNEHHIEIPFPQRDVHISSNHSILDSTINQPLKPS